MRALIVFVVLLLSCPAFAQESPVDPALAACREQVAKLAEQVVAIRLDALVKSEEARAYEAAKKQRDALVPPTPKEAKR